MKYRSFASLDGSMPGKQKLLSFMKRLGNSTSEGYRTPFFSGKDERETLHAWFEVVKDSKYGDLENSSLQKAGPYYSGQFETWEHTLQPYYDGGTLEPFDLTGSWMPTSLRNAAEWVITDITQYTGTLKPLSIHTAVDLATRNTNLGLPYFTSDWESSVIEKYVRRGKALLDGKSTTLFPFVLFRRVQPGGYATAEKPIPSKQRPVWGADHADTFAGLVMLKPLVEGLKRHPDFVHLRGMDETSYALSQLQGQGYTASIDLQQCDATFKSRMLMLSFYVLSRLYPTISSLYWERLYWYYMSGDLVTPNGVVEGAHGLPSGCVWTNLAETVALRALYYEFMVSGQHTEFRIFGNGDDGLLISSKPIDRDALQNHLNQYGLILNAEKTLISQEEFNYLQMHFRGDGGVMPTVRMLTRIIWAERGVDTNKVGMSVKNFWSLNALSKLENCKRHPNFEEFVYFVKQGDKFGLDITELLDVRVDQRPELVGSLAYNESTGIRGWKSVEILASTDPRISRGGESSNADEGERILIPSESSEKTE